MQHLLFISSALETAPATAESVVSSTVILGALILKVVDLLKYFRALTYGGESKKDAVNSLITLAITSTAGILAVFLFKLTSWADEITIGNDTLASLSLVSTTILGLVASSIAATIYDFKKALDRTDSASTPRFTEVAETQRLKRVKTALPTE